MADHADAGSAALAAANARVEELNRILRRMAEGQDARIVELELERDEEWRKRWRAQDEIRALREELEVANARVEKLEKRIGSEDLPP